MAQYIQISPIVSSLPNSNSSIRASLKQFTTNSLQNTLSNFMAPQDPHNRLPHSRIIQILVWPQGSILDQGINRAFNNNNLPIQVKLDKFLEILVLILILTLSIFDIVFFRCYNAG